MFPQIFSGVKVLDFSRLLPGPFASLLLAKMGAEVRCVLPPVGDPLLGAYSPFKKLEEGKTFVTLDLKSPEGIKKVQSWLGESAILLEGFRPGTMERLGLGFEEAKEIRPDLLYVSIVGYPEGHAKFLQGSHDMNFLIDSGLYSLIFPDGADAIPAIQLADVLGGFYAAFQIVARWVLQVQRPQARFLRLSVIQILELMGDYLKEPNTLGLLPLLTGGLARYHIYKTKDGKRIGVASIEEKFYRELLRGLELPVPPSDDQEALTAAIAQKFSQRTLHEWREHFQHFDACLSFIPSREEVLNGKKI